MDNILPHNRTPEMTQQPYKYQPFPKAVYGPGGLEDCVIIKAEEERPEGYVDYDELFPNTSVDTAVDDTDTGVDAKKAAKAADKARRAELMAALDEANVSYAKNLSTPKLEQLKVDLDAYLSQSASSESKESPNDSEQHVDS